MRSRDLTFLALTMLAAIGAGVLAARGAWGVPGEWQWQHRPAIIIAAMRWWKTIPPAAALIAFCMWLLRRARRQPGATSPEVANSRGLKSARPIRVSSAWVLVIILLAFALQQATIAMAPAPTAYIGAVVLSPVATTYFGEAGKVGDLRAFLCDYAVRMRTFSQHAQTYPPGPILLFWAVRRAVERSPTLFELGASAVGAASGLSIGDLTATYAQLYGHAVTGAEAVAAILAGWLLGLLGCMSIAPMYLLARDRWGAAAGVCAAALCASLPALILFAPSVTQLVALSAAMAIYLLHLALWRRSAWWAAAAGAMWTIAALTSLALLVLPLLVAAWIIIERVVAHSDVAQPPPAVPAVWRIAIAWVAGSLALFAVAYVAWGINFPAIVRSALAAHREVTTQAFARTYSRWLGWNLVDFWMFLGAGLGLWMVRQLWAEVRCRGSATPLLWAVVFTVIALDVSGVVRAEVGRIWMFLMLPAAAAAGRFVSCRARPEVALGIILAAQMLQVWAFGRYLALFVVL